MKTQNNQSIISSQETVNFSTEANKALSELQLFLKESQITNDPDKLSYYGKDWTKHYKPHPSFILFPKNTLEVQKIVLWANQHKIGIVPSGGRTGLSGGAYALNGEVVVSFENMNAVKNFNEMDQTVDCEAGVVTEQLQNFAKDQGLYFPVDFASRGSSQIGGNIATNAGGIKVIRYGLTRHWIHGLTVVTGKGEILKLNNSLVKNASGYDLRQLFIGSEGTLGLITEASILLTRPPKELSVFLFAVQELSSVMKIYTEYKKQFSLSAFEMFTDIALSYVEKQGHVKSPLNEKAPLYVLLELENEGDSTQEKAMDVFAMALENEWVIDGVLAQNSQQAKNIWRLREDISEATANYQPYKNDISVRISQVPAFLTEMAALLQQDYPHFEVVWFGHIGDGNLHINILKPDNLTSEEFVKHCKQVDDQLFQMIQKYEGSVSAEHGVGLTKKPFLHYTRSPEEIALMKQIKQCFDPQGIMNPGKIF